MQPAIIEKFADVIKDGAIVTHACTIPTPSLNKIFEDLGKNVNVASYHPGAVPEMKGQVYIAEGFADAAAIETLKGCIQRGESRMRNFQRALIADGLKIKAFPLSKVLDIDHVADIKKAEQFLHS
jgi:5,10-methenyltetrahydromethanopterin hydrogenase